MDSIKIFFPYKDLRFVSSNEFCFEPNEMTDDDSIINTLLFVDEIQKYNAQEAIKFLVDSKEPKEITSNGRTIQTLTQSGFAIFAYWLLLGSKRDERFDELFCNPRFQNLRLNMLGSTKEGLCPIGLLFHICCLETERLIHMQMDLFLDFASQNLKSEIFLNDNGISSLFFESNKWLGRGDSISLLSIYFIRQIFGFGLLLWSTV